MFSCCPGACMCVYACVFVLRPLLSHFHNFLPLFLEGGMKFPENWVTGGGTDF